MNAHDNNELRELLTRSIAPMNDTELRRDLWPQMLQRLEQQHSIRVPWFDWTLAAIAAAAVILFPEVIPALLYHL
jgi:hypothetical protein